MYMIVSHAGTAAGTIFLALTAYVAVMPRKRRNHYIFMALTALLGHWAMCFALLVATNDKQEAWFWYRVSSPSWTLGPIALFYYFSAMTGRLKAMARPWLLVPSCAIALVFMGQAATGHIAAVDFVWTRWGWDEIWLRDNPWTWAYLVFFGGYSGAGLWLVYLWHQRRQGLERQQSLAILATGAIALALATASNVVLRFLDVHYMPGLAPVLLAIWAGGMSLGVGSQHTVTFEVAAKAAANRLGELTRALPLPLDMHRSLPEPVEVGQTQPSPECKRQPASVEIRQ